MSTNIDPVTGLPDLSSDVYQIPLNTDSLPYKDLQADARLPRQPLLPDDIIPTIALLTGLDSDNTGQVVHTDDNHAAKVYVVNQPAPSTGGGGGGGSIDFSTLTVTGGGTDLTFAEYFRVVQLLGTTRQKLYRLIIAWYIDLEAGAPDRTKGFVQWKFGSATDVDNPSHVAIQPAAYLVGPPDIISPPFHYVYDFPGGMPLANDTTTDGANVWLWGASSIVTLSVGTYAWCGD